MKGIWVRVYVLIFNPNMVLAFAYRSDSIWRAEVTLKLYEYVALVRPHWIMEFSFGSHTTKKSDSFGSVQRRITKIIQGFRNLPYSERLIKLNLYFLEKRKLWNLIGLKWVKRNNKSNLDEVHISKTNVKIHGNGYKLYK